MEPPAPSVGRSGPQSHRIHGLGKGRRARHVTRYHTANRTLALSDTSSLRLNTSLDVAGSLDEETDPRLPAASFRRPVESGEVRPEPAFLQANTTSSPQDLRARLAATWMPVGFRVNNRLGSLPVGPAFGPLAVPGILECPLAKGLLP
ncbi:hypothetical protein TURU_035691 [Turdus rufiventris]|nr:hypothetical protein TURU_035691 [Turdus rufiventris]